MMENKTLYAVHTLVNTQVSGAIGYIPIFDNAKRAIKVSDNNKFLIKKMIVPDLKSKSKVFTEQMLNKIRNQKIT
jgi:uncharacterized protein (UPF0297 family)